MPGRLLPDLGPRGEGWFLVQVAILGGVALAGSLGPAWSGPPRVVGVAFGAILIGSGGLLAGRGVVDLRENLTVFPKPRSDARLVVTGAYGLARHPIYGGLIVGAFGWGLVTASPAALACASALAIFFGLKSSREERWLVEQLDGYREYRSRTHRFIPWLF